MISPTQLINVLKDHIGEAKGITAEDLARQLGSNARDVRAAITELRLGGTAVCGHPALGYFIAATPEELDQTCEFLHSRAMTSLLLSARMRRISMQDLIGQLRLPT